jgi:probable F420-dependent oxidoreductase
MTGAQALGSSGKSSSLPNLGRFGLFLGEFQSFGRGFTPRQAKDIEALGYGAVWVAGSPPAELDWVEPLLEQTSTLQVATGIVNIWTADAGRVSESFHRIDKAYPGRFLLGIGAGHPEVHEQYRKPLHAITDYLDKLDEYGVPKKRRVVAALGPNVLKLSAGRAAGAHPYLTTPEHTAKARAIIGPDAFLAPEHKVVLTTDPEQARKLGRKAIETAIDLANYRKNWQRLGFTDGDLAKPGSDGLIDSVVAYGTPEAIAIRLQQFLDAGANHVPVQVLTGSDTLVQALAELAGPLRPAISASRIAGNPRAGAAA